MLLALAACLVVSGCVSAASPPAGPGSLPMPDAAPASPPAAGGSRSAAPNIVLVLMDDFSMDLLPTMRHARTMARRGASYPHAFVVDSLCCVSRAATFTGQYPHQNGVLTNGSEDGAGHPIGGWPAFAAHHDDVRSFAPRLQRAGYTTGLVGKFLNQYEYVPGGTLPPPPRGWSDLRVVFGSAYDQWDYDTTYVEDGRLRVRHVEAPDPGAPDAEKDRAYAGRVIADEALDFIGEHRDDRAPYFLEVAPYGTHNRTGPPAYPGDPVFPAEMRDRPGHGAAAGECGPIGCNALTTDDLPGFGDPQGDNVPRRADGSPAPAWNRTPAAMPATTATKLLRDRARMAQSIDRMLARILRAVGPDTYVVLTSDNGLHLGQHGLGLGKGTAYDSDIHVPLLVVGPGIAPGPRPDVVSNIDLAPTFEELAGLRPARHRAGRSLVASLEGGSRPASDYAYVEHTWSLASGDDPDLALAPSTRVARAELDEIPSYVAVRSRRALLVRYDLDTSPTRTSYAYELYDYRDASWERTNRYGDPRYAHLARVLRARLADFDAERRR